MGAPESAPASPSPVQPAGYPPNAEAPQPPPVQPPVQQYAGYPPPAGEPPVYGGVPGQAPVYVQAPPPGAPVIQLMPAPIPGIPLRTPVVTPQPGMVLLGFEVYRPRSGCFQCDGLSAAGLISVILLVLFFWPLAWIPCVMPECYEPQQRPVYGYPPGQGPVPAAPAAPPGASPPPQ